MDEVGNRPIQVRSTGSDSRFDHRLPDHLVQAIGGDEERVPRNHIVDLCYIDLQFRPEADSAGENVAVNHVLE